MSHVYFSTGICTFIITHTLTIRDMSVFQVPDYASVAPTQCLFDITSDNLQLLLVFRRGNSGTPRIFRQPGFENLVNFRFPTRVTNIYQNFVANIAKAKLYVNLRNAVNLQATYLTYLTRELFLTTHGKIYNMGSANQVATDGLINRCSEDQVRQKLQQHFLNLSRGTNQTAVWDTTEVHNFTFSDFAEGKFDVCMILF